MIQNLPNIVNISYLSRLEIEMVFSKELVFFLAQEHTGLHSLNADYGLQKYIMQSLGKFLVMWLQRGGKL